MIDKDIIESLPLQVPFAKLIWTAVIDVGAREDLGPSSLGHCFIVPILGGRFYASRESDGLNGIVLPGGADRQLLRGDGVKELDALYDMKIEDGPVITVRNQVVIDETRQNPRYAMSVIKATVETGRFDWLCKRLLVGTLHSLRPERSAVVIRAWIMDNEPEVN